MKMMSPIYDDIREAIRTSKRSRYSISKEIDIRESQLCEFMGGTKGLSVESLERVADCLGLEVTIRPKGGKDK